MALQFIENTRTSADLLIKNTPAELKASASSENSVKRDETRFQTHLLTIKRHFESALSSLKLSENFTLFVDGIDIRPASVPYDQYLDCVKGLANAVWGINNDFFPGIRDSKGRLRVVLLLRPDIYNSLGLQNRNTKLKDNSIVLNWNTKYNEYRRSDLFKMEDRLFSAQQKKPQAVGAAWDFYFPFDAKNIASEHEALTSFILFLRYSFHRPRDILAMLDTAHELYVKEKPEKEKFLYDDFTSPNFKQAYGDYLLGEIKDSLSFYYDESEYELFLKFFEYLNGKNKFDYDTYLGSFADFSAFLANQDRNRPGFMQSPEDFLQFLYDQNVICYIEQAEDERFIRWCFLERSMSNISPKVKSGMVYEIHYGLANVLNTGKPIRGRNGRVGDKQGKTDKFLEGRVKFFEEKKGFGFIKQDQIPVDIHFSKNALLGKISLKTNKLVRFRLIVGKSGKFTAVDIVGLD